MDTRFFALQTTAGVHRTCLYAIGLQSVTGIVHKSRAISIFFLDSTYTTAHVRTLTTVHETRRRRPVHPRCDRGPPLDHPGSARSRLWAVRRSLRRQSRIRRISRPPPDERRAYGARDEAARGGGGHRAHHGRPMHSYDAAGDGAGRAGRRHGRAAAVTDHRAVAASPRTPQRRRNRAPLRPLLSGGSKRVTDREPLRCNEI